MFMCSTPVSQFGILGAMITLPSFSAAAIKIPLRWKWY